MSSKFQKLLSRKHTVLTDHIIVSAWNDKERFVALTGFPDYVSDIEIVDGDFCFDTDWMDAITRKYSDSDEKIFWDFVNNGYKHGEAVKQYARDLDMASLSVVDLKNAFGVSVDLLKNLLVFLPITHPLAKAIEQKLRGMLKSKNVTDEQMNEALLVLTKPDRLNTPAQEIVDLQKIKERMNTTDFDVEQALAQHVEQYGFLGYREPFSKGYDIDFFRERLNEANTDTGPSEQLLLSFTETEMRTVHLMREMVYFRNYRTEKLYEALYYLEPLWKRLGKEYRLAADIDLAYYTLDEVAKLFDRGDILSEDVLIVRKAGHAFLLHDNVLNLVIGDELVAKKASLEKRVDTEITEIKGSIACKGKASGQVKLVTSASEQAKVQDGDILVASMTTPDFIPCMKRAAAFITDEGGITCHAAIVAREMKKPCIIGTKNATKILKDGDMVEVDADKGVVRIIEIKE